MIDSTSRNTHYFLGDGAFLMRRIDHDGYNGFDCFPFSRKKVSVLCACENDRSGERKKMMRTNCRKGATKRIP
jgi:hypothetical protein